MFIVHARVSASEPICMSSVSAAGCQTTCQRSCYQASPRHDGRGGEVGREGAGAFMVWANTAWPALCGAGWVNKSFTGWQLYWGRIELWLTTLITRKPSRAAHRAGGGP
jgi:hypothetical protein